MHPTEGDNQLLRRDSSQTLRNGPQSHAIGEEEDYQLPKQVHAGDANAPYPNTHDEEDRRSYKSTENADMLSKNMKESFDSKMDYRIESSSRAQNVLTINSMQQAVKKSPSELARQYDNKLSAQNTITEY